MKITLKKVPMFPPGDLVATETAVKQLSESDIQTSLNRHLSGDWGDVGEEEWASNNKAVKEGTHIVSLYKSSDGTRFYIVTEADRSSTTVLLPEDF